MHSTFRGVVALAVVICACGGDKSTEPSQTSSDGCRGARDFQTCLPGWQQFAPLAAEQTPAADGTPVTKQVTQPLEQIDSTGATVSLGNVTFVCTDQTYKFSDNPDKAMSFNLDQSVIWPGALVQGRTHRDATSIGQLLELPIRERSPLSVNLTFNNQDNTRSVDNPDASSVSKALGSMIGNAEATGLATSNNIDYLSQTFSSEKQAALSFGISGRYLAFESTASGSLTQTATTNTVAAKFVQQMYVASVTQPATPQAFFSSAFSDAKYAEQQALGRVGPSNPPLYVSRIGYGRMMMFEMTATASASDMRAALDVSWHGVGSSAGASLSKRQASILQQSQIRITQVGGDQTNALNAIRSGRLSDYFTDRAPLTSAQPLWFELKSLTGEVAEVSEPGTYTQTTCTPKLPGTFDYRPEQALAIPFTAGTQRQTVEADVNGDGRMDLVFNERRTAPAMNRVHVAIASGDGTFTLASPADNPNNPSEGWENYTLLVADLDGDGRADLVWNTLGATNVVYTGMTKGDGSFVWRARQQHPNAPWTGYHATTGDLNGDGKTDILWTNAGSSTTVLRAYFGLAQPDSSLSMISNFVDEPGNYSGYDWAVTGNFDGAKGDDFVVNALGAGFNNSYVALFSPTSATRGTLAYPSPLLYGTPGWSDYLMRVGDIDGQHGADLVWVNPNHGAIHRAINKGNGTFTIQTFQQDGLTSGPIEPFLADFNDDGRADLLMMRRSANLNELTVGFGVADGKFTFPAGVQTHPSTPSVGWLPFQVFVGDVNGDGKADIVWTNPSSDARVYVALAR